MPTPTPTPTVAVVLAGCGRADGTEITEAVCCLIHLARRGVAYRCFAPDAAQPEVVDHRTGTPTEEQRNMLVEAARIARGEISPLSGLREADFEAVVFPGGFGAAKNLCTFASEGPACTVLPDVRRVVEGFYKSSKPIGMACIAPVIAARVLGSAGGGPGCTVTIGNDAATAKAIAALGATNVPLPVTAAYTDADNRLVTTPAYMCDADPHGVYTGIGVMIDGVLALRRPRTAP